MNQLEESDHETQRALKAATSSHNTRYYCRRLELALKKVHTTRSGRVVCAIIYDLTNSPGLRLSPDFNKLPRCCRFLNVAFGQLYRHDHSQQPNETALFPRRHHIVLDYAISLCIFAIYLCKYTLIQPPPPQVRLSVLTSARLRPELAAVRAKFGRRLVQFEGAQVELDPFVRHHPFETAAKLTDSVLEHYKEVREVK